MLFLKAREPSFCPFRARQAIIFKELLLELCSFQSKQGASSRARIRVEVISNLPFNQGCLKGAPLGFATFLDIGLMLAQFSVIEERPLCTKNIRAS
jgi:hypothetical protein